MSFLNAQASRRPLVTAVLSLTLTLGLAACDGSSNKNTESDGHGAETIDSQGRLLLFNDANKTLSVYDIKKGSVIDTFTVTGEAAPRLYNSPDNRYAVVVQRGDGKTSFIDSGFYVENHGDHMHEYEKAPAMNAFSLQGTMPTHYTAHSPYALVFNDGAEGVMSSVDVLSDASIGEGKVLAQLNLDNRMHGVAKWAGDKLFVTRRDASITDTTLPAELERYSFDGSSFTLEHRYSEQCPKLHGAGANEKYLVFGCGNGLLSVDLSASDLAAKHIANPSDFAEKDRIGTVIAHEEVSDMIGTVGFPQRRLFILSPASENAIRALLLPNLSTSVTQGYNADGERFYSLANDGQMHFFDTADWSLKASLSVTDAITEDSKTPVVSASKRDGHLYLLDPNKQQVVVIDPEAGTTTNTIALPEAASNMLWMGLPSKDAHEHE